MKKGTRTDKVVGRGSKAKSGEMLHRTNQTLSALIRYSPLAIVCTDVDSKVMIWNPAAERIFGWTEEEVLGKRNPIVPEEKEDEYHSLREQVRMGEPYLDRELVRRKRDGSLIHLGASSAAIRGTDGKVAALFALFQDITGRKRNEDELAFRNAVLATQQETSIDGILVVDDKGMVISFNRRFAEMWGFPLDMVESSSHVPALQLALTRVANPEQFLSRVQYLYGHRDEKSRDEFMLLDGRTFDRYSAPMLGLDGKYFGRVWYFRDITDRKQAEEALRAAVLEANEEKAKSEAVISALGDQMVILDPGFRVLYQNKPAIDAIGDHAGKICYRAFENRDEVCEDCPVILSFKDGLIHRGERVAHSVIGTMHLDITASPLSDASGKVTAVIEMVKDITGRKRVEEELRRHRQQLMLLVDERTEELKEANEQLRREIVERERMEEELIKAQKLESLGILAGGIAHDFNNLLTTTVGNISLAMLDLDKQHPAFRQLAAADRALLRAQDLTRQLLTFSRGGAPVKRTMPLGDIIQEVAGFALRGTGVRYDLSVSDDLWLVDVDAGQISQVLHNLIINAEQAMPEGGTIAVRCENVVLAEGKAPLLGPGKYVKVTVHDSGIGILKEHLPKIFDPYFTTKQRGSGLGLATSYSIIRKHDGHISAKSAPGAGTVFTILLPAAGGAVAPHRIEEQGLKYGSGTILLMDDEEDVRQTTGDALVRLGYTVVFAEDGTQAVDRYQAALRSSQPFDAVIVDLTVPGGMGGKEAVRHLLKIDPGLKAIVSSGYSNDPIMADYRNYGFAGMVSKPYRLKQLSETVYRVINRITRE